jgi:V8-like Glu-specific endopeptidase
MPPTQKRRRKRPAAGERPAPPIEFRSLRRQIKARDPIAEPPSRLVELSLLVAGDRRPEIQVETGRIGHDGDRRDAGTYELRVGVAGAALGRHAFGPTLEVRKLSERRRLAPDALEGRTLAGFLPDHLGLTPLPERLAKELRVAPRIDPLRKARARENQATTVFAPENRYTFNDTRFPWCTTGRVDTAAGFASGVMIGPRHLLTVSHTIVWNPNNTAGWVKFTPSYFDGSAPFGIAWGRWVYFERKVVGPGIDNDEGRHDYVVVVLDRRMGDVTGWMGSRTYSDSWDGGRYWSHIGYPGDLAGGSRPSFEGSIALDGTADPQEHQNILHRGDVWPGQSGGPFFGWWSGEPWPRAVSVQSWQNPNDNGASGGSHMVDLVIRARADFP